MRSCRGGENASAFIHWLVRTTGGSIGRFTPSLEITMAAKKKGGAKKAAKKSGAKKSGAKKSGAKKGGAKKAAKKSGAKKKSAKKARR